MDLFYNLCGLFAGIVIFGLVIMCVMVFISVLFTTPALFLLILLLVIFGIGIARMCD